MLFEVAVVLFGSGQVVPVAQFAVWVSAALVSVVVVVAAAVVAVAELVDWQVVGNTVFDLAALRYFL